MEDGHITGIILLLGNFDSLLGGVEHDLLLDQVAGRFNKLEGFVDVRSPFVEFGLGRHAGSEPHNAGRSVDLHLEGLVGDELGDFKFNLFLSNR